MIKYMDINTNLGKMRITESEGKLSGAYFENQKYFPELNENWVEESDNKVLKNVSDCFGKYFDNGEFKFPSDLAPKGTDFQQEVWNTLKLIPKGETWTYQQVANHMGRPSSTRAVASAIGKNPISVIIPCHRVVGSNGSLTGYAGGLKRKRALLDLEKVA